MGWGRPARYPGIPCRRHGWGGAEKICGISGALETGEGERVPPPRRPHPPWRYPHGPQHGEILEKNRARWPTGFTPDTAAHLISPRTDPAPGRGRGRSAAGAGGVGEASRRAWVACRRRRGWGGGPEGYGYPPVKAREGWGPTENVWATCLRETAGEVGLQEERHAHPPPAAVTIVSKNGADGGDDSPLSAKNVTGKRSCRRRSQRAGQHLSSPRFRFHRNRQSWRA